MSDSFQHIPIQEVSDSIVERLKIIGFNEVIFDDDMDSFKDFFGISDQIFEDSFSCLQILYLSSLKRPTVFTKIEACSFCVQY